MRDPGRLSATPAVRRWTRDRLVIVPGEHRLPVPDRFRSPSMVSMHLIPVRRHGTPETNLVSDLVRTHTCPGHENGPQAELAGR
jgi:hypothetical protein